MSGPRPFRMLARMPDDVPRDMPHMVKTFPGRRAFIPSNSGERGRCSLVRRKRTPALALNERRPASQRDDGTRTTGRPGEGSRHATGPAHVAREPACITRIAGASRAACGPCAETYCAETSERRHTPR